jgi:long-chain acyl-CoA synthetase
MKHDSILESFQRLASRAPLAPLVLSPERRVTFEDVEALSRAAGSVLAPAVLPPGTLVCLLAPNGPGFLASFLALRRAGCAALLLDAQTPPAECGRILTALGAAALLRCRAAWPSGPADWTLERAVEPDEPIVPLNPAIAVVKLTSGSTGLPRGIATPAEALIADDTALAASMGLHEDERILATIPMSHSYGLSSLVMPALMRGSVLVVPAEGSVFDPFTTGERTGVTFYPTAPAYLDAMLRVAEVTEAPPAPASLRLVITAGAPLGAETSRRFRERFGLAVHVFYGASECGGICFDREGGAAERGTVGSPVEGVRVTLEDGDGEEGVVTVRSPAVARGFLPAGEEPDPRLAGGRFRAGDLAVWKDGELALRGRLDDLVNIKGKKVNPREVEAVIGQIPEVEEVAVIGLALAGPAGEILRAVVACRPGSLTAADIHAWCRPRLSAHKVPRSVILVPALPRTERGKLDRRALLAIQPDGGTGA